MKIVKVGIIGFGFMGKQHADTLKAFEEVELTAVCDSDSRQLKEVPEGVGVFREVDELLALKEINTVIIAVPNAWHKEFVLKTAKAGKHIICEKPAAMSVEEYDEMVRAAKENNVMFTVHHQHRWDFDYRVMKEVYDKRVVGDMYLIKSQLYGVNGAMRGWYTDLEAGGGMLYDWGVHLIDQILVMVDSEVDTIFADVQNVMNENVDDYFNIVIKFKNGITAQIELGTYYLTPKRAWFIGGKEGSAVIDGFHEEGKIIRKKSILEDIYEKITMTPSGPTRNFGMPEPGTLYEEPLPWISVSHQDFFVNYINAFQGEEELMIRSEQVRKVLKFVEAVRESARTNKAVRFE